jgi:antitoxin component YwqK of YwqJK toxin-antitoxin module
MNTLYTPVKSALAILLVGFLGIVSCKKKEHHISYDGYYGPNGSLYPYPNSVPDTNRFVLPYAYVGLNGYTKFYYPSSGLLISEGNYENGTPSGYWKLYYPNGNLMREGNYSNGTLSGYWKFYYESGLLKEEGNYENNIRSGYWKSYNPNGTLSSEGNYTNGNPQGEWKYYDLQGLLVSTVTY